MQTLEISWIRSTREVPMRATSQQLSYRLLREPTLAAELRQAIVFALVPLLIAALAAAAWVSDPESVPGWFSYAGPLLALVLLVLLWTVAVRARRLLRGAAPLVETSALPVQPGQPFLLRVLDSDAAAVNGIDVFLIAEDVRVERVSLTRVTRDGWRFTEVVRHQAPLLSVSKDTLRGDGNRLDRTLTAEVPAEFADRRWRWAILVVGPMGRGLPRIDRFPLATG